LENKKNHLIESAKKY